MPTLSNEQLTIEASNIVSSLKDVIAALNNLAPKTMVNQLEILNQNDHDALEADIADLATDLATAITKLNLTIDLLNRVAIRVGIGPQIDPLDI